MKKKKKMNDLDRYVAFSLSALIIFTIVAIIVQVFTGQELSETLITCFFSAFGGELFLLARIKKLKLKKGDIINGISSEQLGIDSSTSAGNSRCD